MATQEDVQNTAEAFMAALEQAKDYPGSFHPEVLAEIEQKVQASLDAGEPLGPAELMTVFMQAETAYRLREADRQAEAFRAEMDSRKEIASRPHEISEGCSVFFEEDGVLQLGLVVRVAGGAYTVAYVPYRLRELATFEIEKHPKRDRERYIAQGKEEYAGPVFTEKGCYVPEYHSLALRDDED